MPKKLVSKRLLTRLFVALLCLLLLPTVSPSTAKAEGEQSDWNLVGQVGGTTKALALDGSTLYVGSGFHVLALDVSNPAAISQLGMSPLLPDFIESITVGENGKLYVACGLGGLVVLDVSNPASPAIAGTLNTQGYTEGVSLLSNYALTADGPMGLQVIDVSNPAKMKTVAQAYPLAYAYDVAVSGSVAYLAGGGSGVFAVDLSDPRKPKEAGLTPLDGFTYDLQLLDGRIYAACAWGGVSVLDIETSLAPKQIATSPTSGWAMSLGEMGNDLLVFDGADGVMVYGTAPTAPVKLSAITLGGFVYGGASRGTTVFALDREKGLMSLDFSKKSAPSIISRWMPLLEGRRLTAEDGVCYVAGGLSGMHVYDMQNVSAPLETYWYDTGGGYANQVLLDSGRIYLSTHLATREPLVIFDAKNPQKPTKLGAVPNDERVFNSAFRAICMGENALLVAGEQCEMTVKIDDPSNPAAWGRLNMPNPINVDRSGSLMVTTNNFELQLVDVSKPESPQLISTLAKNSGGEAVRFLNPTTLITTGDPGVWIVDVSDPKNPKKVSELAIPGSIMEAHVDGTTAYLPNLGYGVEVVDLSDLTNPQLVGSIPTIGLAYDCFVDGDLLYVADSYAGMTVYRRGVTSERTVTQTAQTSLPLALREEEQQIYQPDQSAAAQETKQIIVTSAADSGTGTLREALEQLAQGTTITFDPAVFPAKKPVTISLNTELPPISQSDVTLDASNAGVILDGSNLKEGNGITVAASRCIVMGLQIYHFPRMGLETTADYCQIGGDRSVGDGPMGQGNLVSGNKINGFHIGGWYNVIQGNFAGLDVTGKQSIPNFYGMFVSDWAFYTTVGGLKPGEANVLSGNQNVNFDSWGDHTRVIGNIFGLDVSGQTAVRKETFSNLTLESGVKDNVIGGTTVEERNIISGANVGIVFSDPNSYSCSVIGNYIGTDISGTKAIGNHDGVLMWTSGNHRVGGTRPGEANLISGNQNGVQLNGYGVTDNLVLGNTIGYDVNGKPMPNECAVSVNMGQKHAVIGGYTSAEGNRIYGGSISMRISDRGVQAFYFAGNAIDNPKGLNLFLENGANHNFVQGNTFGKTSSNCIRVDYGEGNLLSGNTFASGKPQDAILLLEGGNKAMSAPESKATPDGVVGKTVPFGRVEVYRLDAAAITPLWFVFADKDGVFSYSNAALTSGTKVVLLVSDAMGNTSAFSDAINIP
jgi:hypothetical protein